MQSSEYENACTSPSFSRDMGLCQGVFVAIAAQTTIKLQSIASMLSSSGMTFCAARTSSAPELNIASGNFQREGSACKLSDGYLVDAGAATHSSIITPLEGCHNIAWDSSGSFVVLCTAIRRLRS